MPAEVKVCRHCSPVTCPLSDGYCVCIQDRLAWEDPRSNRGYVKVGRERVTQSADASEILALREAAPDFKESMEIGRDWESQWKNQWPVENDAPEFKSTMLDFFQVLPCF